jgi:hypothetical protein
MLPSTGVNKKNHETIPSGPSSEIAWAKLLTVSRATHVHLSLSVQQVAALKQRGLLAADKYPTREPRSLHHFTLSTSHSRAVTYNFSRSSSVSKGTTFRLVGQGPGLDSRQRQRREFFPSPQRPHLFWASYSVGTGGSYPRGKVPEAWSWPLTSIQFRI